MMMDHVEWNAVLAHELRSPVAAILGYQELLDEGTFGQLPPAAADAIGRIRLAADQLLFLIDAIEQRSDDDDEPRRINARDLIDTAVRSVAFEAEGRGTRIDIHDSGVQLFTRRANACRAIALALGAAIKVSPGLTLTISAATSHVTAAVPRMESGNATTDSAPAQGTVPQIIIANARFDPARDHISPDLPLTGAALRLQLARTAAGLAGGTLILDDSASVHIVLPRLTPA